MELSYEDLIGNTPVEISGIGHIKIPKLQEIWDIKYKTYELLCNYLTVDLNKYLELTGLTEKYKSLSDEGKIVNTLFNLIIKNKEFRDMYLSIFSFFIIERVKFDANKLAYITYYTEIDKETKKEKTINVGKIDNSNFNEIRRYLMQINYMKSQVQEDTQPKKFKNEFARKLVERMEKASAEKAKKASSNGLTLGKMISKYCAVNKNGINMLNVFNLSIYQFYEQWIEHNNIRQCDIQDMIYANTVTLSDIKAYDSQLWLK